MHRKLSSLLSQTSCKKTQIMSPNSNTSMDITQLTNLHMQILKMIENNSKDTDIMKIMDTIKILSKGLEKASQSELELGYKDRQLQKAQQLYSELEQKFQVLKTKYDDLEGQNKNLKTKIDELMHQNQLNYHQYQLQTKLSGDLNHKVTNLESRLEIILESDFPNESVNIRKTLTDLVKECERQKRELQLKNQEISRLTEQYKSSQQRISKLNQKLELMKKKISIRELENLALDRAEWIEQDDKQNDPTQILIRYQACDNLDFRINALKLEFADIMNDIQEQGTTVFTQKVMQSTQKQIKESIQLVTSQYLSFKDFSEKLNMMLKQLISLQLIETLQEQMQFIEYNFKHVFMCQNTRLWILDAQMGILYSSNNQRVLINKGSFSEVLRFQKPIHKRDYNLLCDNTNHVAMYTNQSLLYPIFNQNQILSGILEISNSVSDYFSFDEEYYGVILAKFCEQLIKNQIKTRLLSVTLKFDSMVQNAFNDFLLSKTQFELYKYIRHWMETILTVSMIAFYFVKNDQFITYKTIGTSWDGMTHKNAITQGRVLDQPINLNKKGIAKQVCDRKKELIVMNMRKSIEFDETIDLDSILPVLIHPIIFDNKVIAVFEVPIKQRNLLKQEKDKIMLGSSTIVGLDQSFEMMAAKLGTTIMNAINILKLQ
ncbi:unnamed protein product [Paramecium primaurelia]|uniref:GAF domain-containing protein n=2 Tax=Paramecium TaxID=5884 RepID=A0A8S1TGU5_9CILI|nr:unnamed protein product [Paramecium primaurelia]CAD8151490.1 unnamed protein product [Paramecium pentaurelia]